MHGEPERDAKSGLEHYLRAVIPSSLRDYLHSFISDRDRDTHEKLVRDGDDWFKNHLGAYIEWARTHNSLLIVTFDEDDDHAGNHIATIILGAHVRPGRYAERNTHYNVFSTLLAMYALPPFASAVTSSPIYSIWEK